MASRCLNLRCVRSAYLQTLRANQKTFIPTSAKLLRSISAKNEAPCGLLSRPYSTPAPIFYAPPKPLTNGSETVDVSKSLVDVGINNDSKQLVVSWEGGDSQVYPYVWLRDNCRCPKCFHPSTLSRLTYVHQLNVDITAKSAEISQDGGGVTIHWDDDHQSQFPSYWLREYRFDRSSDDEIVNTGARIKSSKPLTSTKSCRMTKLCMTGLRSWRLETNLACGEQGRPKQPSLHHCTTGTTHRPGILHHPSRGDVLTMDNRRVLHGRNSFQVTGEDTTRHLEGGYMEWDEVYARMRVLATEFKN